MLLVRKPAPGGQDPNPILFSNDGARLAIGHQHFGTLEVVSAETLALTVSPDLSGWSGDTGSLAWTSDGSLALASQSGDKPRIRIWASGGKGKPRDLPLSADASCLIALAGGRLAYGGVDGSWAVVERDASLVFRALALKAAFASTPDVPLADATGTRINFLLEGTHRAEFSAGQLTLAPPSAAAAPVPPMRSADGRLQLDGCPGRPAINGKATDAETCRFGAVAPDGRAAVIGQSFSLRALDRHGKVRWSTEAPAVNGVAYSGDGRWVIAALADSTLRWYRAADGAEALAFLVLPDNRWVAWTPGGHYAASEGGEDLVGWQIDHGDDRAADFFPASRLHAGHFRPDVISRVLLAASEADAVAAADAVSGYKSSASGAGLPPVVTILSPEENASVSGANAKLIVRIRSPSGDAITAVRALVNGREVARGRGVARKGEIASGPDADTRTITVPISGDAIIAIIAETASAISEPAVIHLRGAIAEGAVARPRLRALILGIGSYAHLAPALPFAAADAKDFAAALVAQDKRLFESVETRVLLDADATRGSFLDGLEWLEQETAAGDVAAIFIEGYVFTDPSNGRGFHVPHDGDLGAPRRTLVSDGELRESLAAIPGKVLAFLDSRPAPLPADRKVRGASTTSAFISELASAENGVVVFSAAAAGRTALESSSWGGGAFTRAVIEGLSGAADARHTGRVTVNMLSLHVRQRVSALTQGAQDPVIAKPATVPDFPVALTP